MKKIAISLLLILLLVAALPIVGNQFMQNSMKEHILELSEHGVTLKKRTSNSSYLTTEHHFEFFLSDSSSYAEYISNYTNEQLPPYVYTLIEGASIGVDVKYSNMPLSKSIELSIYPLEMPQEIAETLQKRNSEFYYYLKELLAAKTLLYHINYNILSQDFDAYIKDIREKKLFKDATALELELDSAKFEGNGELLEVKRVQSSIKRFALTLRGEEDILIFLINNLHASSDYESKSTYITEAHLDESRVEFEHGSKHLKLLAKNINLNGSSNIKGNSGEIELKNSIELLELDSNDINITLNDINMNLAIDSLEKHSYENFLKVAASMRSRESLLLESKFQESLSRLLSKGVVVNRADISVKTIILNADERVGGFKIESKMTLKEDSAFMQKLQISPLLLLSDIENSTDIKISKLLYRKLQERTPFIFLIEGYMQESAEEFILKIEFANNQLLVNGEKLQ